MKKFLKILLLILFLILVILFFNQSLVEAATMKEINTMEELKTAFGEKAIIDGNIIKLTDNVLLENDLFEINIPEVIIDFNGKTLEYRGTGRIGINQKVTFKDSSTRNRENWGGLIFNAKQNESIFVKSNAELIINNGKFIDGGIETNSKIYVDGKLIINDATFSTNRTKPVGNYNYIISLSGTSDCTINGGEYTHTDTIIYVGGGKYTSHGKLVINGGNFNALNLDAISIFAMYPYVDKNNNKNIITPKVTINNCTIKSKHSSIGFWGGCADEEFINADTKILTINGGTYTCSENSSGAPLEIRTYSEPNTYFNPKDFVLNGGTFESSSNSVGALRLLGPRKRRI